MMEVSSAYRKVDRFRGFGLLLLLGFATLAVFPSLSLPSTGHTPCPGASSDTSVLTVPDITAAATLTPITIALY